MKKAGFSLIELMVVVAIIAILAMVAIPKFTHFLSKAKRAEAYANLHAIYAAEQIYKAEHGTYTTDLRGAGWRPEGYKGGGIAENFNYTYGFPGAEGKNYFTGKLQASSANLSIANAGKNSFVAVAAGDIDGDGDADVITIDETGAIKIVKDDLS